MLRKLASLLCLIAQHVKATQDSSHEGWQVHAASACVHRQSYSDTLGPGLSPRVSEVNNRRHLLQNQVGASQVGAGQCEVPLNPVPVLFVPVLCRLGSCVLALCSVGRGVLALCRRGRFVLGLLAGQLSVGAVLQDELCSHAMQAGQLCPLACSMGNSVQVLFSTGAVFECCAAGPAWWCCAV